VEKRSAIGVPAKGTLAGHYCSIKLEATPFARALPRQTTIDLAESLLKLACMGRICWFFWGLIPAQPSAVRMQERLGRERNSNRIQSEDSHPGADARLVSGNLYFHISDLRLIIASCSSFPTGRLWQIFRAEWTPGGW